LSELVTTVARFGFLVLLWAFVFAVVMVIRRDVGFGKLSRVAAPQVGAHFTSLQARVRGSRVPKYLVVTGGELAGLQLGLGDAPVTIGRAEDSTIVVTDEYVSTHHARLVPSGGEWLLEDLGSLNGTYLGNDKVTQPTPVPINTPIRIANTSLELRP
jgi:hypothetical protein